MSVVNTLASAVVKRRRVSFAIWALLAALVLPHTPGVEHRLEAASRIPGSDSERVAELMASRFASPFARSAVLVVKGVTEPAGEAGQNVLRSIVAALESNAGVAGTFSLLDEPDDVFIGRNGGTFIVVGLKDSGGKVDSRLQSLRLTTAALGPPLRATHPEVELLWTGEPALNADLRRVSAEDANQAERRVLPLTLALLGLAFGAIMAALLPIGLGALAIAMTLGLVALLTRVFDASILVLNVATMLGLGLGIDYSLLLVSRYREARGRGLSSDDAAIESASHAGQSVCLSGAAVVVGFLALLLVPLTDLRSIGIAGALVTIVSVALATTLLPGVLASLGHRVEWGRVRSAPESARAREGRWHAWSRTIVRRPLLVLVVAGVPTGALAWQWRGLDTRTPGGDWLPPSIESARGLRSLREMERSGIVQGIRVILELPGGVPARSPEGWEAMSRLTTVLQGNPSVARVRSLPALLRGMPVALAPPALVAGFVSDDDRFALLEIMPAESPGIASAMALVREVRALDVSGATGLAGARLIVGGLPAFNVDYGDRIAAATPRVVVLVLGATFVALLIGFRSILIPVKAIALNLFSVGAAFGAVVLVFQHGYGSEWLGLAEPLDGIFPAVPLLVFCTVFGLSMDYEVFLVSRVAEARRGGAGESEAIVEGVSRTGGVITSAGLVMIVVFGAFVMSEFIFMKILGLALAIAVAIDVTVIRLALGPALLQLAGRWNWWPGSVVPVILLEDEKVNSELPDPISRARLTTQMLPSPLDTRKT